jgi:hypothetical protein
LSAAAPQHANVFAYYAQQFQHPNDPQYLAQNYAYPTMATPQNGDNNNNNNNIINNNNNNNGSITPGYYVETASQQTPYEIIQQYMANYGSPMNGYRGGYDHMAMHPPYPPSMAPLGPGVCYRCGQVGFFSYC